MARRVPRVTAYGGRLAVLSGSTSCSIRIGVQPRMVRSACTLSSFLVPTAIKHKTDNFINFYLFYGFPSWTHDRSNVTTRNTIKIYEINFYCISLNLRACVFLQLWLPLTDWYYDNRQVRRGAKGTAGWSISRQNRTGPRAPLNALQ